MCVGQILCTHYLCSVDLYKQAEADSTYIISTCESVTGIGGGGGG